jgi:hypothetical protein
MGGKDRRAFSNTGPIGREGENEMNEQIGMEN